MSWVINANPTKTTPRTLPKPQKKFKLYCKECLLNGRRYYTISSGMPSDIERHRNSRQHLETSITTVPCNSDEGIALLERSKTSNQGPKRKTVNPSGEEPCSKRSMCDKNNLVVEKQNSSTPASKYQEQRNQTSFDQFALSREKNISSDDSDTSSDKLDSQPDDENDPITENLNQIERQTTKSHEQMTIDSFATEHRCCKGTDSEQSLAKDIASEIVRLMKEMEVNERREVDSSTNLTHTHPIVVDLDQWRKIGNISALVEKIPCIEFFYDQEMGESVIRCSLCFCSISNKDKSLKDLSPYRAARKKCGSDHGNLCTGISHGKEKTEQYIKGSNSDWRLLKFLIRSHLLGISNTAHGKQHFSIKTV